MKILSKQRFKTLARQSGTFKAQGNEIMLYGAIGDYFDELTAQKIVNQIKNMSGDITVRVNSPGGDVFDGIAIMNALKAHSGKVTVVVEALAASIASVIAMAGQELVMLEGSFLMIHNPWCFALGDAEELRQIAGVLDQVGDSLAGIYARKTGKTVDEIKALMSAETWMSAEDAVELGFADSLETEKAAEIENFDLSAFNNVPDTLKIAAKAAKPATVRDFERALHNLGFSRAEAKAVASGGFGVLDQRDAETEDNSAKLLAALENRTKMLERKK